MILKKKKKKMRIQTIATNLEKTQPPISNSGALTSRFNLSTGHAIPEVSSTKFEARIYLYDLDSANHTAEPRVNPSKLQRNMVRENHILSIKRISLNLCYLITN